MTPSNFLHDLRAIHGRYRWFVDKDARIRATLAVEERSIFDPITAVAFAHTGEFFPEGAWSQAAASIGLSLDDCADFISACNFNWHISSRQGAIRQEVLNAIGIFENTNGITDRLSSLQVLGRSFRKRSAGSPGV